MSQHGLSQHGLPGRLRAPFAALGLLLSFAAAGFAQAPAPPTTAHPAATAWRVQSDFAKNADARENLSGAACAPTKPPFASCLVVNDQKKYAQFFAIAGSTLVPGAVIRLLGDEADSDPDGEGAAYADGFFYVVGSHGLGRKSGKLHAASFLIFRFKVDPATGKPAFPVTEASVDPAIEKSAALRKALQDTAPIGAFAEKPLGGGGVNIEGVAVRGGRIYAGLRGPSIGGKAFILSAAIDGVFKGAALDASLHELALGPQIGIRDLAAVQGGLLVLAGPVQDNGPPYSVWFWNEKDAQPLAALDLTAVPADAKAETVLVLDEQPDKFRVLVMFDGIANGGPLEFAIAR